MCVCVCVCVLCLCVCEPSNPWQKERRTSALPRRAHLFNLSTRARTHTPDQLQQPTPPASLPPMLPPIRLHMLSSFASCYLEPALLYKEPVHFWVVWQYSHALVTHVTARTCLQAAQVPLRRRLDIPNPSPPAPPPTPIPPTRRQRRLQVSQGTMSL